MDRPCPLHDMVHMCIYIYIHIHIYMYIYIYMYIVTFIYLYSYFYFYFYVCKHVCVYVCMYVCFHTYHIQVESVYETHPGHVTAARDGFRKAARRALLREDTTRLGLRAW